MCYRSILSLFLTLIFLNCLALSAHARTPDYENSSARKDYYGLLKGHSQWNKLPVNIYFVHDSEYSASRERAARAGFDLWEQATGGYVTYKIVESSDHAQITVTFDPTNDDGHTTTTFTSRRIVHARIVMGIDRGSSADLECTAAHEFAHALGLSGHSNDSRDLMYPSHIMGRSWSITRRDLNTLAQIYHVDSEIAMDWAPQTCEIRRTDYRRYRRQERDDSYDYGDPR